MSTFLALLLFISTCVPTFAVTCYFTVDNTVKSVFYNGIDITSNVQGNVLDWGQDKTVTFVEEPGASFVIQGEELDGGSCGCTCSGFQMRCDATDQSSPWHELTSGSPGWRTKESDTGVFTDVDRAGSQSNTWNTQLCTSTSGFYLPSSPSVRKIWSEGGKKYALFAIAPPPNPTPSPTTTAPTPTPTPSPTTTAPTPSPTTTAPTPTPTPSPTTTAPTPSPTTTAPTPFPTPNPTPSPTCVLKNDDPSFSEVNDAMQAFCPDYATDVGVKGKPQYGGSAEMCKQKDQKYETRLHQAMFHGMFGGASGSGRVCKAWCLYDVEEQNRHFRWDNKKGCWKTRKNRPCKDSTNEERGFAADIFDSFCAV